MLQLKNSAASLRASFCPRGIGSRWSFLRKSNNNKKQAEALSNKVSQIGADHFFYK